MSATHHARLVPRPSAPIGSLLELIQLARQRDAERHAGSNSHLKRARELCLGAADAHKQLLETTYGREGLRSYVLNCPSPWAGLWLQIERALSVHAKATA
jgi:hypothetical protein